MNNAGTERIKRSFGIEPSEFCSQVANLLDDLFLGIYHMDQKAILRADWTRKDYFEIVLGWIHWGTFDSDNLTRLVILAHHYGIKAAIEPASPKYIRLKFWKVTRKGFFRDNHPTIEEAIDKFYDENILSECAR